GSSSTQRDHQTGSQKERGADKNLRDSRNRQRLHHAEFSISILASGEINGWTLFRDLETEKTHPGFGVRRGDRGPRGWWPTISVRGSGLWHGDPALRYLYRI